MSSSQPFHTSSPIRTEGKKSRFTFKQLTLLSQSSTTCSLRCIAHIDLDAFYAQCEVVRLGIPEDQPLAVQQWQGLIAVNYPARVFGVNRHAVISEAKKLCPQLICQHVATWREGEGEWKYREDSFKHIHTDKVSLDPYRLESRKILTVIKNTLPGPPIQRVEKASIDEVFFDLSAQIHGILLERYPELKTALYGDPTENLPRPPSSALDWQADALVDLDSSETEDDDPDWDDVIMNIGSEIVRDVRKAIREQLKYTCSAGIARNKMMAKLGSGANKPNLQTIVRNRAVQHFLSGFKFTKIRNLGGKLGDQVVETFHTDELTGLLKIPIEQLKSKLGDDTGTWVYGVIRGEDTSEVNSRTEIKSMLSAKSFRPSINSFEQGTKWLRIFVADIYARLVDEGVVENKRRPKTMTLHHRQGGHTRSKGASIPSGKKIDVVMLFELAKALLGQVIMDGRAWPCSNLSLSVGGFEDGVTGNRGIGSFLLKGDEAKAKLEAQLRNNTTTLVLDERPEKRRKQNDESSIQRFFPQPETSVEHDEDYGAHDDAPTGNDADLFEPQLPGHHLHQHDISSYFCKSCQKSMPESNKEEHDDWHFAKDLQAQDTSTASAQTNSRPSGAGNQTNSKRGPSSSKVHRGGKTEKGQRRLAFG
jgi:DNA polymerase eta